jgi:hypothetical protein
VSSLQNNSLFRFLSSLQLTIYLLLFIGAASAVATFIESSYGADGARALVYNTRWFEAALALLAINMILVLIKRMPYTGRQTGFVLMHIAVIVILIGAGITRFFGYEGFMPIREGDSTNFIFSARDHVKLDVDGETASFPVRLFRTGPQGISRSLAVANQKYKVEVKEYWTHYAETYVAGEGGTPAVQLATVGPHGMKTQFLLAGESLRLGNSRVRFLAGELDGNGSTAPHGELLVHLAGATHRLPVPAEPPVSLKVAEHTFTITEFQPDFKVGQPPDPTLPPNNPMIRVAIEGPEGQSGERMLFALHPDFDMGHGGGESDFADLKMLYEYERGLTLAIGGSTGLLGRATVALAEMDMNSAEVARNIPPGEVFEVNEMVLYKEENGDISFVAQEILASAVLRPGPSDDPNASPAARVAITGPDGHQAEVVAVRGQPAGGEANLGPRTAKVELGPIRIPLPYRLHLDDFLLLTYPGSENPASYESHVRLYDSELGIEGEPVRIYMNHPLTHRGFKHFQSSYDTDRKGTILSVNYDPGKWPTYAGYTLICIGFILILAKNLIWRRTANPPSPATTTHGPAA